jgi:glycosyltransferase involved in cell wall biosynthesis
MKLALVGDWPPPQGGVSIHVAALATALRARGDDVRVLDIGKGDHEGEGVVRSRGPARYAAALARAAAERRLVHVHTSGASPKSWLVALGAGRARLPGSPSPLLTVHSGLAPGWLAGGRERRELARAACAGFGRVVTVSRAIAAAIEGAGVAPERLAVLPAFLAAGVVPGAPPRRFAALRQARAPLFCAALAPTPTYGEGTLLEAFTAVRAAAPNAALAVFGPGTERGAAAALGLRGGVLALGELDHGSALGVVAASDAFVRPTIADGDALSVREALALGRPVVASAVGDRPPGCLLFRAGDAAALAARMLAAAQAPAPRAQPPLRDPFEALLAIYGALTGARPIPSDSAQGGRTPCSQA